MEVNLLAAASAVVAFLSGYLWVRSATAEVKAPEETTGVGAPMGGYLITKNEKGQRLDMHATLLAQTKWNARAAIAAAASAALAVLSSGAAIFPHH